MFLSGKKVLSTFNKSAKYKEIVKTLGIEEFISEDGGILVIDFPMGYWRKDNQIHNWFVKTIQRGEDDCRPYGLGISDLAALKYLCEKVLADNDLAPSLLPTKDGFFFGTYQYDDVYFDALKETIKIIDRCFASGIEHFEYQSSW
jgi:hypothetical protein